MIRQNDDNGSGEAEDIQHGSDHSLEYDDNLGP